MNSPPPQLILFCEQRMLLYPPKYSSYLESRQKEILFFLSRKCSAADVLMALGDDHIGEPSQTDLGVIQHLLSSLPHTESTQRSSTFTQSELDWSPVCCATFWLTSSRLCCVYEASTSEQEDPRSCPSKFSSWGERRSSRDVDASSTETSKRGAIQMFLQLLWLFRRHCY